MRRRRSARRGKHHRRAPRWRFVRRADGANGAARFSATVRFGNTLSRSGTRTTPRRAISLRRPVLDPPSLEGHAAVGDAGVVDAEEAGDRPQGRGLAGAVGAEDGDDLSRLDGETDALHRGDRAVIDDLELVDARAGGPRSSARARDRPILERPQQKVVLHAAPDADQPERLEHQKQDHDHAEGGIVRSRTATPA